MAQQDEQLPGPTGRAVALARLLHHECTSLLQLYKQRERLDNTPDCGRIVSLAPKAETSAVEKVQLLHSALRQCLGLLQSVNKKEEEEWGKLGDNYETMKMSVLARLENLLLTTKDLVEMEGVTLEISPDHRSNKEVDGAFALKVWIFRVLLELIHWADHAAQTLHVLHKEREGTEQA